MSDAADLARCAAICDELAEIMTSTGVVGFLPSVTAMRGACEIRPARRGLDELARVRRSVNGGMGSYNDIVFWWDDDPKRTAATNDAWQALNDELWRLAVTRR